jgi:hypothetical protein
LQQNAAKQFLRRKNSIHTLTIAYGTELYAAFGRFGISEKEPFGGSLKILKAPG